LSIANGVQACRAFARAPERLYHCHVSASVEPETREQRAVLVLGVGNSMKGDDGVGPRVVGRLTAACKPPAARSEPDGAVAVVALDCGVTPENYTSVVRRLRPALLLIVDAADMGLAAGECRIIPSGRVGALGLSTHSMPLSMFMSYVSDLASKVVLIGVQPRVMALGAPMSSEVAGAGDALARLIAQGRWDTLPGL